MSLKMPVLTNVVSLVLLFCLTSPNLYAQYQQSGEQLFKQHCAVCHGIRGQGGIGVPLSSREFINVVDDDYLRTTISSGRIGRVMPAFDNLKANEVNAIIKFMRSWTGKPTKNYSSDPVRGDASAGKILYDNSCATCHGLKGRGGHGTGVTFSRPRNLPVLPPALNNPGFLKAAKDQVIKAIVTNGHKGSPLEQSRDDKFTDTEVNHIVAYIRSFENIDKEMVSPEDNDAPVIIRESPYDFQTTIKNLKEAVVNENLRLIRVQNLEYGFTDPSKENQKQVVVYSCGFGFLYQALKVDPRIGIFLPCRVTVVEQDDKIMVMAINPKKMRSLFNNSELDNICDDMHKKYVDLIEGALL